MRHQVIVRLPGSEEMTLRVGEALTTEAARVWLDQEFERLKCVPTRPTGKVLLADKLLAVAEAAAAEGFADGLSRATMRASRRSISASRSLKSR